MQNTAHTDQNVSPTHTVGIEQKQRGAAMAFPDTDQGFNDAQMGLMIRKALGAADFLKAIAHEGRLLILCHLASGEKSVSDLEQLLHYRQAAVSQQLSRLRLEGLVKYRRDGKVIYYSLVDDKSRRVIDLVYDLFCDFDGADDADGASQVDK